MKRIPYFILVILFSCSGNDVDFGKLTDVEGNSYKTVFMPLNPGWMAENLRVGKFRNGDSLFHAKSASEWKTAAEKQIPAYCDPEFDTKKTENFGRLYNWYAINDPRGLAPEGWKIPGFNDWEKLINYADSFASETTEKGTAFVLKSTAGWEEDLNGNNSLGFSVVPAGFIVDNGNLENTGSVAYWWSKEKMEEGGYYHVHLNYVEKGVYGSWNANPGNGFSVRCVKSN
jgi:uncharacterized protein (TIGR02145 family)